MDDTSRLALILPENRLWEWHRRLVGQLSETYAVDVFLDGRAPAYSLFLRGWLRLERSVFGQLALATPIDPEPNWRPVSELANRPHRSVLNLSEMPYPDALDVHYDGTLDSCTLVEQLLSRRSPSVAVHQAGQEKALTGARLAIENKYAIQSGLEAAFMRTISLITRALQGRNEQIDGVTSAPRGGSLFGFVAWMLQRKALNLAVKPLWQRDHWHVALRNDAGDFKIVQDDGGRFYADPFLQTCHGRTFLFVEEYPYATHRGVISAAEIVGDEIVGALVPVLTRPYHLSYPFVFENDGEIYMLPETGENRTIELYRAVEFPAKWELSTVLMQGAVFSDATMLFHEGLWWLFVTATPTGASTQDELSIFYSEAIKGPWTPHAANPVKSDSRSSRSGGRIVQRNGRLFRPAQDCDRTYGAGLTWFEITELTPSRFTEREIAAWDGEAELGMNGLHSFDQINRLQAIDFKQTVGRRFMRKDLALVSPRNDLTTAIW